MSAPAPAPDTPQGQMSDAQKMAAAIAAQAQMRSQTERLAEALIPQTQPGAILAKGKVVSWETGFPPTVTIQLGGDTSTSIAAVRYMDSYTPVAGDTVVIAKQGSEITVLGKIHEFYLNQPAKNGWQPITPTTTWNGSNNTLTPPLWRRVFDHGDQKIQFQGRVWRNGTNTGTTIFTLPAGYTPGIQRVLLAARENLGGANEVQINVNTSGVVEINGHLLAGPITSGVKTSYYSVEHLHRIAGYPDTSLVQVNYGGSTGYQNAVIGGASTDGGNSPNHRHTLDDHRHIATFPGWISLDGLEFFL